MSTLVVLALGYFLEPSFPLGSYNWLIIAAIALIVLFASLFREQWVPAASSTLHGWRSHHPKMWIVVAIIFIVVGVVMLVSRAVCSKSEMAAPAADNFARLANEDDADMGRRIHLWPISAPRLYLDAPDPYLEIERAFTNATVFQLELERVEGKLTYHDHPLRISPELLTQNKMLAHAEYKRFELRQFLSSEVAADIKRSLPTVLGGGNFAIVFSYHNLSGEKKYVRFGYGGIPLQAEALMGRKSSKGITAKRQK